MKLHILIKLEGLSITQRTKNSWQDCTFGLVQCRVLSCSVRTSDESAEIRVLVSRRRLREFNMTALRAGKQGMSASCKEKMCRIKRKV